MAEFTGHVRAMRADSEFFGAEDLVGLGDVPFQIDRCERFENREACGKKQALMFTLFLKDKSGKPCSKELWIKPTNRKSIVKLYGANVKDWAGKWLWMHVTEVPSPGKRGETTLGIRIRDRKDAPAPTGTAPAVRDVPNNQGS